MTSSPHRHHQVLKIAAVMVASGLALSSCGRGSDSSDSSSSGSGSTSLVVAATFPQSGPLAVTGAAGRGVKAAIDEANADGGINGSQVKWVDYDDAYDPARMVANARKAVQKDKANVLVSFGGPSLAIRPYVNESKVFNLVLAGNTPFSDTKNFPYTHAAFPDLKAESSVMAAALKKKKPNAVVGVLGFNNDLTDSQVAGITAGGLKSKLVLKVPPSQQDVTSQITQLKEAGVDTLFMSVGGGQIIGAVKYMAAVKYQPTLALYSTTAGKRDAIAALGPAAKGITTAMWVADPADPLWAKESNMARFKKAIAKSGVASDADSLLAMVGYLTGIALVAALGEAGGTDGASINKAWESIDGVQAPGLPPGTTLTYSAGRLQHSYQVVQYDGTAWKPQGPVVTAD